MSSEFDSMLTQTSASESLSVDTSYLETYKREQRAKREGRAAPQELAAEPVSAPEPGQQLVEQPEPQVEVEAQLEPELVKTATQRGGSGSSEAKPAEQSSADAVPAEVLEEQLEELEETEAQDEALVEQVEEALAQDEAAALALEAQQNIDTARTSDFQDAVQGFGSGAAKAKKRGGGDESALPRSGFSLPGEKSNPQIRSLPDALVTVMRERIMFAAIDELGASEAAARKFSEDLSLGALATAALMAQFSVPLKTDAATNVAATLYQRRDPFLASLLEQLGTLGAQSARQLEKLSKLDTKVAATKATGEVVEQSVSYLIAERVEGINKGVYSVEDTPLSNKSVITVRDKAREATRKRTQLEIDRDGRPTR